MLLRLDAVTKGSGSPAVMAAASHDKENAFVKYVMAAGKDRHPEGIASNRIDWKNSGTLGGSTPSPSATAVMR